MEPRTTPAGDLAASCLLRDVRLLSLRDVRPPSPRDQAPEPATELVDVRIRDGHIAEIGPSLTSDGDVVHDGGGRWAMPGLWDQHVHMGQWAMTRQRIDVSAATSAPEAASIVAQQIRERADVEPWHVVQGFGQRPALWPRWPAAADLDSAVGDVPVVLVSGDAHHGWLSTAAFHLLGLPPREGVLEEEEWWPVFARLATLPGADDLLAAGLQQALREAAALGVVGIVDLEMTEGWVEWPERIAAGLDTLRVRTGAYRQYLGAVLELGLASGDPIGTSGLVTMGPLKVISDGSLNTRTAFCCEPFADASDLAEPYGVQNVSPDELRWLLEQAHGAGLEAAIHAIGDRALADALDAFAATGAGGSIEHAQLVRPEDVPRMAHLGVRASVQPVHLWDDRDVIDHCWPERGSRCFPLATMQQAGVTLALGSDAPVAALDPWLAVAAAVHRSADDRDAWHPEQSLDVRSALAASTNGVLELQVGGLADLILLDVNPLMLESDSRSAATAVRQVRPAVTLVGGRVVHERA